MTKEELKYNSLLVWLKIKLYFTLKLDAARLSFAIRMANRLQKAKNKRFYVLPGRNNSLIWLCNDEIKAMQKPKRVRKLVNGKLRTYKFYLIDPKKTHLDIMRDCVYYTPESWNNHNGLTVEERNKRSSKWLRYMEKYRMDQIFGNYKFKK